jgi:hypothetical protein
MLISEGVRQQRQNSMGISPLRLVLPVNEGNKNDKTGTSKGKRKNIIYDLENHSRKA